MRSLTKGKIEGKVFYNPDSFSSKVLDFVEYIVGATYIAFSRETLFAKINMDAQAEGYKLIKTLYKLEKENFIKKTVSGQYKLTRKGINRINFQKFFKLSFEHKKRDGFWRLVIFDIPEKEKRKRELLRQKLKEFDFYMIQKSVFVSPYICEKEIEQLCDILNLRNGVCVVVVKDLGSLERSVRNHFG